jgi:ligand-binding sensor domain-containing protein
MIGKEIQALLVKRSGLIFAGLYMNGVFRSSDNGGSWIKMNSGLTDSTVYCLAVNSLGTIFAGTYSGGVFHSTNEGDTWLQGMRIGAEYFSNVAVTKSDAVLTAASNGVYRSSDAGGTWAKVPFGALGQSATSFAADSSGFVYAGTNTGILRSSDDGISWVNLGSISSPIRSLTVSRQNHIFAGMLHGVYQSTDQGISWTLHQDGLPNSDVLCLAVDSSGFLFAATRIGIYKTVTPILTSVCRDLTFLPTSTFLGQNYPNPFNPSTQIEFQLARESRVSLRVFNVVGQEVALLVNKLMDAGTHQTTWNAIGFPAGVYFYRLTAGDFMQSKKMILLK